jgi:hypothetical protein
MRAARPLPYGRNSSSYAFPVHGCLSVLLRVRCRPIWQSWDTDHHHHQSRIWQPWPDGGIDVACSKQAVLVGKRRVLVKLGWGQQTPEVGERHNGPLLKRCKSGSLSSRTPPSAASRALRMHNLVPSAMQQKLYRAFSLASAVHRALAIAWTWLSGHLARTSLALRMELAHRWPHVNIPDTGRLEA